MSSHEKAGQALAGQEAWSEEESSKALSLCLSYTTQLAKHLREAAIEADPSLLEVAKTFSAA